MAAEAPVMRKNFRKPEEKPWQSWSSGVDIDYEVLGADNGMLMVTASGTAVVVD